MAQWSVTMKLSQSLLVGLASVSILGATAALAARPKPPADYDMKSYRATACQARNPDAVVYDLGGICNPSESTTAVEIVCPIVRDNVLNGDGALIVVDAGVSGDPVECTASSWNGPGGLVWEPVDEVTGDTGAAGGFTSIVLQLEESAPQGSYSLSCVLPPDMSCILSYRVWERQGSDDNMTDYNR
jgi:hypothetical protein